jgi:hypothetical protein
VKNVGIGEKEEIGSDKGTICVCKSGDENL